MDTDREYFNPVLQVPERAEGALTGARAPLCGLVAVPSLSVKG